MNPSSRLVAQLAWDQIPTLLSAGNAAILPIGAGAKQHGFHLPMGTDAIQAEWFAARLAERIGALVWPTLTYGYYPAFAAYSGSVSLGAATFEPVVREIVADIRRFGPRGVLILNTGMSTVAPVNRAIAGFKDAPPVRHLALYEGRRFRETAAAIQRQPYGGHADEIETSIMLAIAPELVDMSRALASPIAPGGPAPGPLSPGDPASPNYSPSGSQGDPTLASTEKGEALVAAMLADLEEGAASLE